MSQNAAATAKPQPKISQRMLLRFAIGLIILAALFYGYQWWKDYTKDPDLPLVNDTAGMVAALQLGEEGNQVVVFTKEGELRKSPGYQPGKNDKELTWRPDGNRLFFTSDREETSFHVYRWNFGSDRVSRRSIGTRSQNSPTFPVTDLPDANETALITAGGFVLEYDPKEGSTRQVLPPVGKERGEGEEGSASQFEQIYQRLGTSFRQAKWGKDKNIVAAVMRREDEGEILIVQDLSTGKSPYVVVAGDRIEFDIIPTTGQVAFVVNGFRFPDPSQIPPEAIKNGKVTTPFHSLVGLFDLSGPRLLPVMPSTDLNYAFQNLSVSPDGENLLIIIGKQDSNGNVEPQGLAIMPAKDQGGAQLKRIIAGKIYEPSWHPNSHTIAFVQRDSVGKRGVFSINKDGSGLTDISKGKGDFAYPLFSPQSK